MDLLKEKQLTLRASRRPVEFNYTNADIHRKNVPENVRTYSFLDYSNSSPHDGYQFEYPVNWAGDPSTQKVIGIRRINYKAPSIDLAFTLRLVVAHDPIEIVVSHVFTSDNTFEECMYTIQKGINDELARLNVEPRCVMSYNKEEGRFTMGIESADTIYTFVIKFNIGASAYFNNSDEQWANGYTNADIGVHYTIEQLTHYHREFLKMFNQPMTREYITGLYNTDNVDTRTLDLNDVWNRDSFYCHASFSDSPRQIIGINKDFWPSPSVFYEHSDNSNDFNIFFTTDTVHRILPRNGILLIQMSYIFNYQSSLLSYA